MNYENNELINNKEFHNFEMVINDQRSFINYKTEGNKIYLLHTEVPEALEGKGIASALVQKTFNYIEQHNLKLVPLCSYIKIYLERHPEWETILAK